MNELLPRRFLFSNIETALSEPSWLISGASAFRHAVVNSVTHRHTQPHGTLGAEDLNSLSGCLRACCSEIRLPYIRRALCGIRYSSSESLGSLKSIVEDPY